MTILIPAYEPGEHLIELVKEIKQSCTFRIVIVDDGSGADYHAIFKRAEDLGCVILRHENNRGKGRALKTGFQYILYNTDENEGVVTADADGQHLVKDILRISSEVEKQKNCMILGERKFVGDIPIRSVIGNKIARDVFSLVSGRKLNDTQTGLRGMPVSMLAWLLTVDGERFEYEMNMLLEAKIAGYCFAQVPIETIYKDSNNSSHFRAVKDSVLVLFPFLKFCASGSIAAVVDYSMLFYFQAVTNNLFLSVIMARAASSAVNFIVNKFVVFKTRKTKRKTTLEAIKYYGLVCILVLTNYFILQYFSQTLHIHLFWSKLLTELILFSISYTIQRLFIFKNKEPNYDLIQ